MYDKLRKLDTSPALPSFTYIYIQELISDKLSATAFAAQLAERRTRFAGSWVRFSPKALELHFSQLVSVESLNLHTREISFMFTFDSNSIMCCSVLVFWHGRLSGLCIPESLFFVFLILRLPSESYCLLSYEHSCTAKIHLFDQGICIYFLYLILFNQGNLTRRSDLQ